ncbi:hypothetical protein DEAC_c19110 [Desulfosporosinus acididurans]|uniref:Uncharacterized protein n=1 Tax=Desulfosporosinus acididurans TaxID=476652 RepID=A0A0J1FQU6_9FIRM|nr:hypothetical protein [Desulfosporosinus acididurans]KLU65875.1 hypothetical protein DEAC_c19110 [Desulfosporosinus acididurans]
MQNTNNEEREPELILTLDYIRELFIHNEDSMALQELECVFQRLEVIAQEMPVLAQGTFQQLLLRSLKYLEAKDYVRLSDVLIYEIKPLLKTE